MKQDENILNKNKKTYFITGGGTGGHIYPALAVANELNNNENIDVYYIGNPKNMEFNIVKNNNLNFLPVFINSMPRKINLKCFSFLFLLIISTFQALFYLLKFKPSAIFATGGYVSAPLLIAAILLKQKFIIHDCDAYPGIVSRKFSKFANSVSIAFEDAKNFLNNKNINVNGNPLRKTFFSFSKEEAIKTLGLNPELKTLLIMGGSQGAKSINSLSFNLYEKLLETYNLQIIHQTGLKNYDELIKQLKHSKPKLLENKNLIIKPYFEDMALPLKASDFVISRAGSLSLSEILFCSVPSILIPYPFAAANHQLKNARYLQSNNAAFYIEENEDLTQNILIALEKLITDKTLFQIMQNNAKQLSRSNSLNLIVEQLKNL